MEQTGQNGSAELSVRELENRQLSFDTFLDDVCDRLQDIRQKGSLKRIRKLEERLDALDKELDELILVCAAGKTNFTAQANPACQ